MIREVDLVSYLPPFIAEYEETNTTLTAENPEFVLVWKAADRALKNEFIETADEYGISRFEKMLGVMPHERDDIKTRRWRVRSRWFNSLPCTVRALAYKVAGVLGGEHNFSIHTDFREGYGMLLVVYSTDDSLTEELKYLLSVMVPENIVTEIIYETVTGVKNIYQGTVLEQADILEIKQR